MRPFTGLCQRLGAVTMAALLAACGDSTGPVTERIEISGNQAITVGATVQLSARVLDQNNNVLTRTITWSSTNTAIATVIPASGLVTGVATGTARITARAGTLADTVDVPVMSLVTLAISGVTPALLRAGVSGTITGTGFSADIPSNTVTFSGERMTVTAATETSLQFTVPSNVCVPSGLGEVRVTVAGQQTNPVAHAFETVETPPLNVAVGQQIVITNPANLCLRFAASAGNESYLVGLQSVDDDVQLVTGARVGGSAVGVTTAPPSPNNALQRFPALLPPSISPRTRARANHRRAEMEMRLNEAQWVRSLRLPVAQSAASAAAEHAIPEIINPGDVVNLRVPRRANNCQDFVNVSAVVRVIGERGIWLEDTRNPVGGFTLEHLDSASLRFDNQIYPTNTTYFGSPTDLDANGRIAFLISREVNRDGLALAFVALSDYYPSSGSNSCPSSNVGEIVYLRAPDPTGMYNTAFTVEFALDELNVNVAHEMVHAIQFGRRRANPSATALPTPWQLEGQALIGEEMNGHAQTGRSTRQNYGYEVAYAGSDGIGVIHDPYPYYVDKFFDMMFYYGLRCSPTICDPGSKIPGAPEQCSWLAMQANGNDQPCDTEMRPVYGVPWLLMRWLTDQFASRFPTGEGELHRAIIDNPRVGFEMLADVAGVPISELLAQWSASLYVDDRVPSAPARLSMASWNLFDVERHLIPTARLIPRQHGFANFSEQVSVRAGSTAYFLLDGARSAYALGIRGGTGGALPNHMQVWVVRLQ